MMLRTLPEQMAYIVGQRLDVVDRTIILLYADCASLRTLSKMLGLSLPTVSKEVRRIKAEILRIYDEMYA